MTLQFLADAANVALVGPNGVGKTMCACNLGYQAVLAGHTALFLTAAQLLGDLAALDSDSALRRRLRHDAAPDILLIDEVGYMSYSNRHDDLLFELVSRRYQQAHRPSNEAARHGATAAACALVASHCPLASKEPRPHRRIAADLNRHQQGAADDQARI